MKKIIKILAFALIFLLLFYGFQHVYQWRFMDEYNRYTQYDNLEFDPDMIYIGTSEPRQGFIPIILYEEKGITSYNLCNQWNAAAAYYYELKYALERHSVKAAAIDFRSIYASMKPQDKPTPYLQALFGIPDRKIHYELLHDICKMDPEEAIYYAFPLLRYHTRWASAEADFSPLKEPLADYMLGWFTTNKLHDDDDQTPRELSPDLWNYQEAAGPFPEKDVQYYQKMVDLCREKNVQLIAIIPPVIGRAEEYSANWAGIKQFLDQNGIRYFNYNTYEEVKRIGLDVNEDFTDANHMNYLGAIKWSKVLAQDLSTELSLTDHRQEDGPVTDTMNEWAGCFDQYYGDWRTAPKEFKE